jgi:hypothetical protein
MKNTKKSTDMEYWENNWECLGKKISVGGEKAEDSKRNHEITQWLKNTDWKKYR